MPNNMILRIIDPPDGGDTGGGGDNGGGTDQYGPGTDIESA